jgi:orotate phosphoribosyltransferase
LTDYDHLIDQALKLDYVTNSDVNSLREWKINPENWKN